MEKINVAELLKDCPSGMELDCTIYDGTVILESINIEDDFPITIRLSNGSLEYLTKIGGVTHEDLAKCVIFPKGKTTWEGFYRPFKDGDTVTWKYKGSLVACIYKKRKNTVSFNHHIALYEGGLIVVNGEIVSTDDELRFATVDERQKLFLAIKDNGYKWNPDNKTLEELPKFKVGDRIRHKNSGLCCTLGEYSEGISAYRTDIGLSITYKDLEQWELAPHKFDITTLKPFDKVLVRDCNIDKWNIDFFAYYRADKGDYQCMTFTKNQCIPYESNKYLMGTTNDCEEYFKTWQL